MRFRLRPLLALSTASLLAWACTSTTAGLPDFVFEGGIPVIPTSDGSPVIDPDASIDGATPVVAAPVRVRAIDGQGNPMKGRVIFAHPNAPPYERKLGPNGLATSDPTLVPITALILYDCNGICAYGVVGAEPDDTIDIDGYDSGTNLQATVNPPPVVDAGAPQPSYYQFFDGCYPYGQYVTPGQPTSIVVNNRCTKNGSADLLAVAFDPGNVPLAFATKEANIVDGGTGTVQVPPAGWQPPNGKIGLPVSGNPPDGATNIRRMLAHARGNKAYARRELNDVPGQVVALREFEAPPAGFADGAFYRVAVTANSPAYRETGLIGRADTGTAIAPVPLNGFLPFVGPFTLDVSTQNPKAKWTETGSLNNTVGVALVNLQFQGDAGINYVSAMIYFPHTDPGSFPLDFLKGMDSGALVSAFPQGLVFIDGPPRVRNSLRNHPSRFFNFFDGSFAPVGAYTARYVVAENNND